LGHAEEFGQLVVQLGRELLVDSVWMNMRRASGWLAP
jgi:hypothetical protein